MTRHKKHRPNPCESGESDGDQRVLREGAKKVGREIGNAPHGTEDDETDGEKGERGFGRVEQRFVGVEERRSGSEREASGTKG